MDGDERNELAARTPEFSPVVSRPDELAADARIGYQMAIHLWTNESDRGWSRDYVLVFSNSVILGALAVTVSSTNIPELVSPALSTVGIALCLIWVMIARRTFDHLRYWALAACEIEQKFLSPTIGIVSGHEKYRRGESIEFTLDGKVRSLRMSSTSARIRSRWTSYAIISSFAAVYVALLAVAIFTQ